MVDARDVTRMLRGLRGRVKGIVRRATLGTLNSGLGQSLQAGTTKDDQDDDVELFEPYGFTSGPPPGSEGLVLRVGGERAGSVAICFGNRTVRLQGVEQGEVAVYTATGASIVLRNSGNVEVTPGPGGVTQLSGINPAALPVARSGDPVAVTSPAIVTLKAALDGWVVAPNDGGAALKTALATFLGLDDAVAEQGTGTITGGGTGSTSI